jgi:hypothetical protein
MLGFQLRGIGAVVLCMLSEPFRISILKPFLVIGGDGWKSLCTASACRAAFPQARPAAKPKPKPAKPTTTASKELRAQAKEKARQQREAYAEMKMRNRELEKAFKTFRAKHPDDPLTQDSSHKGHPETYREQSSLGQALRWPCSCPRGDWAKAPSQCWNVRPPMCKVADGAGEIPGFTSRSRRQFEAPSRHPSPSIVARDKASQTTCSQQDVCCCPLSLGVPEYTTEERQAVC